VTARPADLGELLTPDEVAAILRVSRKQVLRFPLRRVMLGRRTVRFDRQDVEAFVRHHKLGVA
jgi:excisionase family DNA binding protein